MARKLALLVGNERYADQRLAQLNAPAADVHNLRRVLQSPEIGGFEDVKVLLNASRDLVEQEIGALFAGRQRDDLLLLYFSGHGILDSSGDLYLALNGTRYEQPLGTAVHAAFIREAMNKSRSRRQILILDCCHSGAFERGAKSALSAPALTETTFGVNGYGREILTASAGTQYAWENDELLGTSESSVFTHFLIKGLESGEAAPGSEEISVDQLYHYVHDQVVRHTPRMTPQRWADHKQGSLVLARNPNPAARPAPLPEDLAAMLADEKPIAREGAVRILGSWLQGEDEMRRTAAASALEDLRRTENIVPVYLAIEDVLRGPVRAATTGARERSLSREVEELARKLEAAQEQGQALKATLDEKTQREAALAEQVATLERKLGVAQQNIESQRAELERKARREQEAADAAGELKQALYEARVEIDQLRVERDSRIRGGAQGTERLQGAQQEVERLRAEQAQGERHRQALLAEVANLRTALQQAEANVLALRNAAAVGVGIAATPAAAGAGWWTRLSAWEKTGLIALGIFLFLILMAGGI